MYDWTDDFAMQAILNYPGLRHFIAQAIDLGDITQLLEMLLALELEGNDPVFH